MIRTSTKFTYALTAIFAVILIIFSSVIGGGAVLRASAETTSGYSEVLDDLYKDEEFSALLYPELPLNYSLKVIQIAENEHGELFVYVYQPCGQDEKFIATTINISTDVKISSYKNYRLELINSDNTLFKYKVCDFKVKDESVRYYNISSIYRNWVEGVDSQPGNDNTVREKAYSVGHLWTVTTTDEGNVTYDCKDVEVVQVTSQMIGLRRYPDGDPRALAWSGKQYCDAHFIAFSCDHKIDKLLSADISFYTQSYHKYQGIKELKDDKAFQSVTVHDYDKGSATWKGTWQRMYSMQDFIEELEVKDDEAKDLGAYDWIINFYETDYELVKDFGDYFDIAGVSSAWDQLFALIMGDVSYQYHVLGTEVTDVTLMRLEFEYEGEIYNLGVVSDKQTGSGDPTNPVAGMLDSVPWWVWLIIGLVILAIAVPVLSYFFPVVGVAVKAIFKGLWWVICSPFKLIANAVKNHKNKPGNKSKKRSKTKGKKQSKKRSKSK